MSLHDRDIREPLFDFLEETYGRVRVIEEKMMGRSRADVVMVTEDALCGGKDLGESPGGTLVKADLGRTV